eukprot:g33675.t1
MKQRTADAGSLKQHQKKLLEQLRRSGSSCEEKAVYVLSPMTLLQNRVSILSIMFQITITHSYSSGCRTNERSALDHQDMGTTYRTIWWWDGFFLNHWFDTSQEEFGGQLR